MEADDVSSREENTIVAGRPVAGEYGC